MGKSGGALLSRVTELKFVKKLSDNIDKISTTKILSNILVQKSGKNRQIFGLMTKILCDEFLSAVPFKFMEETISESICVNEK